MVREGGGSTSFYECDGCKLVDPPPSRRMTKKIGVTKGWVSPELPVPDVAGIDMDEVRSGIHAHTTALQPNCRRVQVLQLHIGQADIDRLAVEMHAALGDAAALGIQHRIGLRAAIA